MRVKREVLTPLELVDLNWKSVIHGPNEGGARVIVAVAAPWSSRRVMADPCVGSGMRRVLVVNGTPLGSVRVRISAIMVVVGVPSLLVMVVTVRFGVLFGGSLTVVA